MDSCSLSIKDQSEFSDNLASIEGGAIKWNIYEPAIDDSV